MYGHKIFSVQRIQEGFKKIRCFAKDMWNLIVKIIESLLKKVKKLMFDKTKYENKIDVLGEEIAKLNILIFAIKEMIKQSEECFEVYKKYNDFFYLTYQLYHNELIHGICRLQDRSRDSLSIVKMLEENIKNHNDKQSRQEKKVLDQINECDVSEKIKALRDKLGRAHLDGKVSINLDKQKKLYEENKIELKDNERYIELLTKALELLSDRLQKPMHFVSPLSSISREIRELFHALSNSQKNSSKF